MFKPWIPWTAKVEFELECHPASCSVLNVRRSSHGVFQIIYDRGEREDVNLWQKRWELEEDKGELEAGASNQVRPSDAC